MPVPAAPSARFFPLVGVRSLAVMAALAVLALPVARAQSTWVALVPPSPFNAPAEVKYLPAESSASRTTMQVTIHGYWKQTVVGDDGKTYQRLTFPGLGRIQQVGAPELPVARFPLAVPAAGVPLTLSSVEVVQQASFSSIHLYPTPGEGFDEDPTNDPGPGDVNGYDEKFAIDPVIYAQQGAWPDKVAEASFAVETLIGGIEGAHVAVVPATWDPFKNQLKVLSQVKIAFQHTAPPAGPVAITKPKALAAASAFPNWAGVQTGFSADLQFYKARYLVLAPALLDTNDLQAFIELKKAMGYDASLRFASGNVAADRATIADWYAQGEPGMDHFCLLVGDTGVLPQGTVFKGGTLVQTDDLYGSVGDDGLFKDIHVGRLSVDNATDLAQQLKKITSYETQPIVGGHYEKAVLVAHVQGSPGKYQAAQEAVRTAGYSHPPVFSTRYGSNELLNLPLSADIDAGVGLVCYRGHGSTNTWWQWTAINTSFDKSTVLGLANALTPVVWSFACTNANIGYDPGSSKDCFGETWLEANGTGAVSFYGATRETATEVNHLHDFLLFQVVYNSGVTTQGQAIDLSELLLDFAYPGHLNPWAYLLLGDPAMTIRTQAPKAIVTNLPSSGTVGALTGSLPVSVQLPGGLPAADALLSAHKASFLTGQADELLAAQWLTGDGTTTLTLPTLTPGKLDVVARTADGSVTVQSIEVTMDPNWSKIGTALPGTDGLEPELVGLGKLQPGKTMALLMHHAKPGSPAWLILGLDANPLPFKGGLIIPCVVPPSLILPLLVDANGNVALSSKWPTGIPSGTEIVTQFWIQDAGAPKGFASSNGLVGVTP